MPIPPAAGSRVSPRLGFRSPVCSAARSRERGCFRAEPRARSTACMTRTSSSTARGMRVFEPVEPVEPVSWRSRRRRRAGERRLRRLAGAAMLVGAVGRWAAGSINISRPRAQPGESAQALASPLARTSRRRHVRSASVHPSAAGHHISSAQVPPSHPAAHASHGGGRRRRAGRKDVAWRGHARGARRNAAVGQGLATPAMLARSEVSVSEPAAPPRAEHAEFGFER